MPRSTARTFQDLKLQRKNGVVSRACVQAGEFSTNVVSYHNRPVYNSPPNKATFTEAWKKARDEQERRVATGKKKPKQPFKKRWTIRKEKETSEQLIKKYKEYGERLGHKYKRYYDYEIDLDFKRNSQAVNEHNKRTFIKIAKLLRIKYWETSNGNLRINLLSETELDRTIYYITITDKWGNKHPIGEILGDKRQVRATHKKEQGEGKWAWKVKNLDQVRKLFKLFFVEISDKRLNKVKHKQIINKKEARNIKVYEPLNISENTKQFILKDIKLGKHKILKRFTDKPIFKKNYWMNGRKYYFMIDTKYSGGFNETILDDLPMGSIRSVVLARGNKHNFFKQLWQGT